MAKGKNYLKGRFETGDVPSQSDFEDLIDSAVNLAEDVDGTIPDSPEAGHVPTSGAVKSYVAAEVAKLPSKAEVTQLSLKVSDLEGEMKEYQSLDWHTSTIKGYIHPSTDSTNPKKWARYNNSYQSGIVDVSELVGDVVVVTNNTDRATYYAFLTEFNADFASGDTPSYVASWGDAPKLVANGVAGGTESLVVPTGAVYLYIYKKDGSGNIYTPSVIATIVDSNLKGRVTALENIVNASLIEYTSVDDSRLERSNWDGTATTYRLSSYIPVSRGTIISYSLGVYSSGGTQLIKFYDEDKSELYGGGVVKGTKYVTGTLTINDSSVAFVRFITMGSNHSYYNRLNGSFYFVVGMKALVYNAELECGGIDTSGADAWYPSGSDWSKVSRTPKFLRASNVLSISFSKTIDNYSVTFYCYSESMAFLGSVNSAEDIQGTYPTTTWLKICLSSTSELPDGVVMTLSTLSNEDHPVCATNRYDGNTKIFTFDVHLTCEQEEHKTSTSTADGVRHCDNGYIMLPPNYDETGDNKVPLVIFCHGSRGYEYGSSSQPKSYSSYLEYISKCGYAVADCSAFSDKYALASSEDDPNAYSAASVGDSRFTPIAASCYVSLYKYLIGKYNLKEDGCYVFGKSNGGLATAWMALTRPFPIRAVGSLAGSMSVLLSMRYTKGNAINYWCNRFGISGTPFSYADSSYLYQVQSSQSAGVASLKGAIDIIKIFDPFCILSNISKSVYKDAAFADSYTTSTDVATLYPTDLDNATKDSVKALQVPMKMWHSVEDAEVPIYIPKMFKKMVENMGGTCFLRTFPVGSATYPHHVVDTHGPVATTTPRYSSSSSSIPVAYIELVEWFDSH